MEKLLHDLVPVIDVLFVFSLLFIMVIYAKSNKRLYRENQRLYQSAANERAQCHENLEGKWAAEDETRRVLSEFAKLWIGIRKHMEAKGYDRCWMNDLELYKLVEPAYDKMSMQLPCLPEFLHNCCVYWRDSQPPDQRRLE